MSWKWLNKTKYLTRSYLSMNWKWFNKTKYLTQVFEEEEFHESSKTVAEKDKLDYDKNHTWTFMLNCQEYKKQDSSISISVFMDNYKRKKQLD